MSRALRVLAVLLVLALVAAPALAQVPDPAATEAPVDGPTGSGEAPPGEVIFPTDELTVADPAQETGRRIDLPLPDCTVLVSACDDIEILNGFDGFDLVPRIAVQLEETPPEDLTAAFGEDVLAVRETGGDERIGLAALVYDPEAMVLYGEPAEQLADATEYEVVYGDAVTPFTTMSATNGLVRLRRQLDSGAAYDAVGIAADERGLSFVQDETRTVFPAQQVLTITRLNETVPGGPLVEELVPNSAVTGAGTYAFGSFLSPSWLRADRTIEPIPTGEDAPEAIGSERVGVTLILPAGPKPEGGYPVAIFGPGITRSKYDLFLAADLNAARGIATMSLDPVGHAFGERSKVSVQTDTAMEPAVFSGFGRGIDLNDDGAITNREGVQAPSAPHPSASIALRDGLRQTALDVMALVRAIGEGADVDGDGAVDLAPDDVSFYAQSLGSIYGTMFMGADPSVEVAALNVPGGSILDIARLSPGFRESPEDVLRDRIPGLLNGGVNGFTESLPLYGADAPVDDPAEGALPIQDVIATANWIDRPGSPESFAPLLQRRPVDDGEEKRVFYQFAFGDQTVPNPTSGRLARAFGDFERVTFYRNDRTATAGRNPHGFLLDPTIQGRNQAQAQVLEWLASDGQTLLDPDGPLPTWETPIADPASLQTLNFPTDAYEAATPAPARELSRSDGASRLETAVSISQATYETATTVVLSRADQYADALAGGPLAVRSAGPLLLTPTDEVAPAVADEIERLGATTAILLGGEAALSSEVASDLEAMDVTVERVGGANRFATAALIAERLGYSSEVLVTEGANPDPRRGWPDALSAAAMGSGLGEPILLATRDSLPQETADAISSTQDVTVIGGPAAVSDEVLTALEPLADDVRRIAGPDRYATSAAVATEALLRGLDPTVVWVATGLDFPDGLAAGAAAGSDRGILLLVDGASLEDSPETEGWLVDHGASVEEAHLSGGEAALSRFVEGRVREIFDDGR